jgi:hypothetical protein
MALFDPWAWRDPAILAGGYDAVLPDRGPSPDRPAGDGEGGPGTEVDLAGYAVAATDGDIGTVDALDATAGAAFLIVDTGPWIFGRTVMLPAGTVERVDHAARRVHVDRTRDQVKHAPSYDPDAPDSRAAVGDYYRETYGR